MEAQDTCIRIYNFIYIYRERERANFEYVCKRLLGDSNVHCLVLCNEIALNRLFIESVEITGFMNSQAFSSIQA